MRVDAVYQNGRIRTLDDARPLARSLAVLHGRIVALDEEAEALRTTAASVVDLGLQPVLPGFNDAHHHLTMRGQRARGIDLRAGAVRTPDELYEAVRAAAAVTPPGSWIYGSGYDQNKLGGRHPLARRLDVVAPHHPVWLEHVSGHLGVGNTAAFERAGFPGRRGVPDVDGGLVEREPGDPTLAAGLIGERAMDLVVAVYKPLPVADIVHNIGVASDLALAEGITSITEPGIGTVHGLGSSPLDVHAFQLARDAGALRVRAQVMPYLSALREIVSGSDHGWGIDLGVRSGLGDEWLRIGPVKVLADGSLIGRSAAMTCPYHGETSHGMLAWEPEALAEILRGAYRLGFRLATHAIGDAAMDAVLDVYDRIAAEHPDLPARRCRIEHASVVSDAQINRIASLGLIPVPQGRFIGELGDGVIAAMGPERLALTYRMRSFLDAGIIVPGSSDAPVVAGSPLLGIHDMVNRRTASGVDFVPAERITVREAVHAYTVGSAYAECAETMKGTLVEGMLADFVVLSDDLWQIDPTTINLTQIGATVVGGAVQYDDGALGRSFVPASRS